MDLMRFFKEVVRALKAEKVDFALAGGMVASLYRQNERTTNDLDFLIFSGERTEDIARSVISELGLKPKIIRKADLEGGPMFAIKGKKTTPYIIAGRGEKGEGKIGLDFILPEMPWFQEALKRAVSNEIDFGFGAVPCITKEDVIISKLYSLQNDQSRFNDLDDLSSIFRAGHDIDAAYVCGQMQRLGLTVPGALKGIAPRPFILTSKRVRRERSA